MFKHPWHPNMDKLLDMFKEVGISTQWSVQFYTNDERKQFITLIKPYSKNRSVFPGVNMVYMIGKKSIVFERIPFRIWNRDPFAKLKMRIIRKYYNFALDRINYEFSGPHFSENLLMNMIRSELLNKYGLKTSFIPNNNSSSCSKIVFNESRLNKTDIWGTGYLVYFERSWFNLGHFPICKIVTDRKEFTFKPNMNLKRNVKKFVKWLNNTSEKDFV